MKRVMFVAMVGLFAAGWMTTVQKLGENPANYKRLVAEAQKYDGEELYVRAIENYKAALEYQPDNKEIQISIAKNYLAVGDESAYTSRMNSVIESNDYPVSEVSMLADYYIEKGRNESAISLLQKALKRHSKEEELLSRYGKVRYTHNNLYVSAQEIGQIVNGCAVYVDNDQYGIMSASGKAMIRAGKEWCAPYSSDGKLAPVKENGQIYLADKSGYRYEIPAEGDQVETMGLINNDVAPAKINGVYGYVNSKFEKLSEFAWDDATQINDGLGAVKKGEKWAILDKKFQTISDYVYDDVAVDENGFFCVNSRAFVKQADGYQMINEKGEMVGAETYEDAKPFVGGQPAAVKKNGKWGFVDHAGAWVIEPQYQDAGSFSGGFAPVQTASGWGYINQNNELVIADEFSAAKNFQNGIAPVQDGNHWTMIELNVKNQ